MVTEWSPTNVGLWSLSGHSYAWLPTWSVSGHSYVGLPHWSPVDMFTSAPASLLWEWYQLRGREQTSVLERQTSQSLGRGPEGERENNENSAEKVMKGGGGERRRHARCQVVLTPTP